MHTKYVDWPFCVTIYPLIKEASKVEHSASYVPGSLLLEAAGGSLGFGCQHPPRRRIRSSGHPLRIAAVKTCKKILVFNIRAKRTQFEAFGG